MMRAALRNWLFALAILSASICHVAVGRAQVGPVPGMGPVAFSKSSLPVSITFGASSASQSPSGISISTAAASRYIVIAAFAAGGTAGTQVTGITLDDGGGGGARSATLLKRAGDGGSGANLEFIEIWLISSSVGTTANIVVTWSQSLYDAGVATWAVYNTNGTASATASNVQNGTGAAASVTVTVPANGGEVAATACRSLSSCTMTYVGATKDYDNVNGFDAYSGAHGLTAGSPLTISATPAASSIGHSLVAAAFSPL